MSQSTASSPDKSTEPHTWYKKLTDYPSNRENPFLEKAVAEMKVSVKRQSIKPRNRGAETSLVLVDDLGEEHGEAIFVRQVEVDEAGFTKIFREGLARFSGLSMRGTKVWLYICDQLKPGSTSVHFMHSQCLEHTGYKSRSNVMSGLAELLEASIIARSEESSLYFINPMVMFNGNRITFAKSYVRKQITKNHPTQYELELNPHLSLNQLKDLSTRLDG
ncbi:RepA protein [Hymenobacter sp. DH14]|uniref:RepA protein n=1 Tax=Hymenobacter cyanobacteriorum TaxID=2926463 RepID=A0A9X1VPT9_9BACT|nr:RepA protein [Hymenobacter cyanobacteriorum]MCI1189866.1 RepA protein [Hymenobacter cyanobacteriorum]